MFLTKGLSRGARVGARATRLVTCAVTAAMVLGGAAACSSDGGVDTEEPVSVGGAVTATPSAISAEAAVLAAYREFFARQTEISLADKEQRRALLEPFTTDPALERVLRGMFAADEIGEVGYGEPVVNPVVQKIEADTATITDCQDTSMAGRKKRESGKITTRGTKQAQVYVTAKRGSDGRWRISTVDYQADKC
jgi:hypothetical protein